MVYSAKSDDINTISQFTRRKNIIVTTGGTSTPANYQVKLTIAYESEMQADFDDIRFNTKASVYIDYWIESKTDSVTADVWIELPDAITDPGSDAIWMYYGNSGLSDGSNIANTMIFGSDFTDDLTDWTTSGTPALSTNRYVSAPTSVYFDSPDVIYKAGITLDDKFIYQFELNYPTTITDASYYFYIQLNDDADNNIILLAIWQDKLKYYDGSYHDVYDTSLNTWYTVRLEVDVVSDTYDIYVDNVLKINNAAFRNLATEISKVQFSPRTSYAVPTYIDNVILRKHIANKPTPTYGTAQHQRRVSQFIN